MRTVEGLAALPAPWRLAAAPEVVLEIKMQGDKVDRYQVERAHLRRQARQCLRARELPEDSRQVGLWMISGYVPVWVRAEESPLENGPGVYRFGSGRAPMLWIAPNELPLDAALIPFLVARTGQALITFLTWPFRPIPCEAGGGGDR